MKIRLIIIALLAIASAAIAWRFTRPKPAPTIAPPVAIRDRATIDFSSGRPVVKNDAGEKAIIDAAVKDMNDAAKNIRFTLPPPPPLPEIKKAKAPVEPSPEK